MLNRHILRQSRRVAGFVSLQPKTSLLQASRSFHLQSLPLRPTRAATIQCWRRWQSTQSETQSSPADPPPPEQKPPEAEDPLKKELDQKSREVIDLKDKYLRSVADFRNLQERTKRDVESARQFAIQRFATDLLDSIDNLDRALESVPQESLALDPESSSSSSSSSPAPSTTSNSSSTEPSSSSQPPSKPTNPTRDLHNLHAGLKMSESILMSTLQKHGLERFDPMDGAGRKFDPRLDEATFFTKVDGKADGEVFHTQSKGFTLNGRVIRAAKVGVVKNS